MSIILNVLFTADILFKRTNKDNLYFQANFLQIQLAEDFTNEGVQAAVPPVLIAATEEVVCDYVDADATVSRVEGFP